MTTPQTPAPEQPTETAATQQNPPTPAVAPEISTPEQGETPPDNEGSDRGRAAREAANYRTRLRETETERDTLRSEVDTYRTREVTRLAETSGLITPADLLSHVTLADLVEDGAVNPELVESAIADLRETRPQWFTDYAEHTRPPTNRPIEGLRPGATPRGHVVESTNWSSLLRDAAKRQA